MKISEHANYLLNEFGRLQFDYAAYCKPNGESLRNEARNNLETYIAELEAERRWIPVSERLPEDGREVLVFAEGLITAGSHCQCGAAFNDDDVLVETPTWLLGIEGEVYGCDAYDAVTHWMPLPNPPEVTE